MMKQLERMRIIVVMMATSFLWQCNTPEKSTLCFLVTYTRNDGAQTESITYVYQNSLLMSESRTVGAVTSISAYEYDIKNNLVKSVTQSPSGNYTTTYSYTSQNKLLAAVSAADDWSRTVQYTYNENRQLSRETSTYTSAAGDLVEVRTFSYPDIVTINPSTVTVETAGINTWQDSLEYDNKINPIRGFLPSIRAANNVVKATRLNILTLLEETHTTSYQYNAEGYPVSATSTLGVTETWTYDCREI